MRNRKRNRANRGVVLLVVLTLLVLFTLLMVTFVIVAGQYKTAAQALTHVEIDDSSALLDIGFNSLVRDTPDAGSVLRGHSLLLDLYGMDGFTGTVQSVGDVGVATAGVDGTRRQFFDVWLAPGGLRDLTRSPYTLSDLDGYYAGRILTPVDGNASGQSMRIVAYDKVARFFRVMTTSGANVNIRPLPGDRVVVGGQPFNGTGFGYTSTGARASKLDIEALHPNRRGDSPAVLLQYLLGGPDESYDAVDFQNMALAGIIPTINPSVVDNHVILPSFHRPFLINYAEQNGLMTPAMSSALLNRFVLRPMPWDHPNFDGSNPNFRGVTNFAALMSLLRGIEPGSSPARWINPWDVDNDRDGIRDSIWVDVNAPLRRMPDGTLVRPLYAFLCVDMDGKLNLNASGSITQLNSHNTDAIYGIAAAFPATPASRPVADSSRLARGQATANLPKGPGLGPPEIYLGTILDNSLPPVGSLPPPPRPQNEYERLLRGDEIRQIVGRYGFDQLPGVNGMDTLAAIRFFEFPSRYFDPSAAPTSTRRAYNNPADLFGELAFGLDFRGQPSFDRPNPTRADLRANSAYETNLSQDGAAGDTVFTIAELERLLRYNDSDSEFLPNRLLELTNAFDSNGLAVLNRRAVTTNSYSMPVPTALSPAHLQGILGGRSSNVADIIWQRLPAVINSNAAATNAELLKMLAPELARGVQMDVNRPFGNAEDDNGNGVVDEHGSTASQQLEADSSVAETIWTSTRIDHDNDGILAGDPDAFLARHIFARHLYCLLMALRNPAKEIDFDLDGSTSPAETARGLAQYAINVVDFRDPDSIMTPFEYDIDPFNANGWQASIDGDPSTNEGGDREIVWGCERPELLITETLAFHDRRTEDLSTDPTGKKTDDMTAPDDDFDQRLRPRGSLFLELYNPWTGDSRSPAELYTTATATVAAGVDLRRRAPSSPATGSPLNGAPVWRLIVVTGTSHNGGTAFDPDEPTSGFNANDVERGIYFADPTATVPALPREVRHFSTLGIAPVEPGRFAVVGSGVPSGGGSYVTTIGRRTDAEDDGQTSGTSNLQPGSTRRIVLTPNASAATQQVQIIDNPGGNTPPLTSIQPAVAAVINNGGILNISEPRAGYGELTDPNWDPTLASGEGAYIIPRDEPLDATQRLRDPGIFGVINNVTSTSTSPEDRNSSSVGSNSGGVCTVHLQRLANPLVPYDPASNPYRSIDHASIDLTVFEGVFDPANTLPNPRTNPTQSFGGRERGVGTATPPSRVLWPAKPSTAASANQVGAGDIQVFDYLVDTSLGYSNDTYGTRFTTSDLAPADYEYVGAPKSSAGTDGAPFPWLTWNNRPYVSEYELLQVPATSCWRLTKGYSIPTAATTNPYSGTHKFGHLLNFFDTTHVSPSGLPVAGSDLYRVFDYLRVPSRFVGTETWLNPSVFAQGTGGEFLRPPFNRISRYRDPGKVNINTTFDDRIWRALFGKNGGSAAYDTTFLAMVDSRRGFGTAGASILAFANDTPTLFANPFRSAEAGKLVPLDNMERAGTECSLLRSSTIRSAGVPAGMPVDFEVLPGVGTNDPLLASVSTAAFNDADRNPFFRYQQIQRMANLVTTQSNVYAIWVTVGFFQVDPTTGQLGQEYGLEAGEVTRHRGFYMFDRSIPVAFEPGENHNIDQAILLRRVLE